MTQTQIPRGSCLRISRSNGKVLQFEEVTPERMEKAARVIAQTLVRGLMKKQRQAMEGIDQ